MNISDEERFHELAHKALANKAQPAEQAELRALIAENPELKEEFEQLGVESSLVQEILPLLEDIEHPRPDTPHPPMQRLQKEIRAVFEPRPESPGEVRELLGKLEKWAARQIGAERERIMELISFLRESLSAAVPEPPVGMMAMLMENRVHIDLTPDPTLREEAEARATHEPAEETRRREVEFENRLRSLEERIRHAEEITHECGEEVRGLLEAYERVREMSERKWAQSPNPTEFE